MKIDRLMGILTLLLRQEQITMPALAKRFEVSRRTIARDIEDICKAGIPLVTIQGSGGGVSIASGYTLDKTLLTKEELQAVFAGLQGLDSVSHTPYTEILADKLSDQQLQVDGYILIDLASHYKESLSEKISLLRTAISKARLVQFRYFAPEQESLRIVEPYLLVFRWGEWYLFSYCTEKQGYRLFKLNRLWELSQTEESFSVRELAAPPDFDDYFAAEPIRLRAVFEQCAKYRLIEAYGFDSFSQQPDETLLFERSFVNYEMMRQWILSFGAQATVLEPKELAEDIRQQAEEILNRSLGT